MASAVFTRWATRCALAVCVYAVSAACSSDSAHHSVETPSDAGSDSSGGDDGVGGTGNPGEAGEGGSNGSDLVPGVWNETTWNEARWQ